MMYRKLKLRDRLSVYPMVHVECNPKAKFEIADGDEIPLFCEFKDLILIATNNEEFSDEEYSRAYEFFKSRLDNVFIRSGKSRVEVAVEVVEYEK